MNLKKILLIFLIIFGITIEISSNLNVKFLSSLEEGFPKSAVHPRIILNSDQELDAFLEKTGSGTIEDPYILSCFTIDSNGGFSCITLQNLRKAVIVANNDLKNAYYLSDSSGIFINNCSNVNVDSNILTNNNIGINFLNSYNCSINNNTIISTIRYGILISTCPFTIISNNLNSYIYISYSDNCSIFNNSGRLQLGNSNSIEIYNNIFKNYNTGIVVEYICNFLKIRNNLCFRIYLRGSYFNLSQNQIIGDRLQLASVYYSNFTENFFCFSYMNDCSDNSFTSNV
jgi:parallel beta-helix repeat protein